MVVRRQEERCAKVAGTHVIADGKSQRRASRGDLSVTVETEFDSESMEEIGKALTLSTTS